LASAESISEADEQDFSKCCLHPSKALQKRGPKKQNIHKYKGEKGGEKMREIALVLIIVLLFAESSQIASIQQVSATSEFNGYLTMIIKQKSDGTVLSSSSPQWFEDDPWWVLVIIVAIVVVAAVAALVILRKDVNKGQGYIDAHVAVTKPDGTKVEAGVKAGSETTIEFPIQSMSEEGVWTFNLTGIPHKAGVGGFVVPVDKFGLLAPYIGLALTILVSAVATAVCVKRVKRRKEKQ
jgi:hypothetical protein